MAIYGHNGIINEAIRPKGQEFDTVSKKVNKDGEIIHTDPSKGNRHATTTIGRGGVLDSVAQHHIEDLDLEKEKVILESQDILTEYAMYISGNLVKASEQYKDNSKSQLEKRMVEDFKTLLDMGIDKFKAFQLITDEWYGIKHFGPTDTKEDLERVTKIVKTVLRTRINYVNKITSLMSKMLRYNYKILGLTEEQADIYIKNLTSGTNDSVKSAGEIKDLIKNNADKFVTNGGDSIDLRPLGFGVILGPTKGYDLKFVGTDGTNKDGMLSLIQQAMRYDVVVVAHGGDRTKTVYNESDSIKKLEKIFDFIKKKQDDLDDDIFFGTNQIFDDIIEYSNSSNNIYKKLFSFYKEKIKELFDNIDNLDTNDIINKINKSISDFLNSGTKELEQDILKSIDKQKEDLKKTIKDYEIMINKNPNASRLQRSIERYKDELEEISSINLKEFIEYYKNNIILESVYSYIRSKITDLISTVRENNTKHISIWSCQPTRTLKAGPFNEINELVRQLIKEGYKKILIEDCNPGGHKLADDIMNTKGILINHSDFSNYVESSLINSNDENEIIISEAEQSLIEFANSFDIDYNDNEYLEECCNWYLENVEAINEGFFDSLKEFFKRILAGIIGFFKKIFGLIKSAFHKLKALFTGTKEEPKDKDSKFQKPIETPLIDVQNKKITKIVSQNRDDLDKQSGKMCSAIASEIKKFNEGQQHSMKKIEADINNLDREANMKGIKSPNESSIFENSFDLDYFSEGDDLLSMLSLFMEFSDPNDPNASEEEEEEEEYSMDDDGGAPAETTPDNAQEEPPAEEEPEEDEEYSMDDAGEEPAEASEETPTTEPTAEEPADGEEPQEDEEYEIPDEETEGGETQDTSGEGEAPAEGDDTGEDEEYSMDDAGGDSGEGGEDTGTGDGADLGGEEPTDNLPETKLKELESVIFDELTEDEKKLKIKELKELYIVVYKKCGTISDMLTDIKRDEETIQIVEYISNTLIDLKQYVDDYINDVFDSKTYIENLSQLQKYIAIFSAIKTVFNQIKQENQE